MLSLPPLTLLLRTPQQVSDPLPLHSRLGSDFQIMSRVKQGVGGGGPDVFYFAWVSGVRLDKWLGNATIVAASCFPAVAKVHILPHLQIV